MAEHTLGPWSVDGSATTDFDVVCADGRIAMVNGEDWSADMAEANAYLIAAAPDLLAALQWALSQIDDDLDPDHQAAMRAAHKTVARALQGAFG